MIDPNRYVRDAVINAITDLPFKAYGQVPPSAAVPPYAIVSVSCRQMAIKNLTAYNATITITLYNEFREFGGRKKMDELSDTILSIMTPANYSYLLIENFNHAGCVLSSSDENASNDNSVSIYQKTLIFNSLINQ